MAYVGQLVPLLVLAIIVTLVVRPLVRRRLGPRPPRPRAERKRKVKLTVVRSQMDDELKDLLRRG